MATRTRSFGGCWTCRLRRKKCDEARPVCHICAALEIDCVYSDDKPEWMDGADRQKQKADWVKREVKRKAAHRRERRHLQGLEVRLESLDASLTDDGGGCAAGKNDLINAAPPSAATTASSSSRAGTHSAGSAQESGSGSDGTRTDSPFSVPSPEDAAEGRALPGLDLGGTLTQEAEAHAIMLYLDYVFPFLFPFYRPSFLDVGRGWLLVLLTKNKALFHSAISLAQYFYGIVLGHVRATQECQVRSLGALHKQHGLALQWLQREMQDIVTRGVKGNLAEANRVMASIIQLMLCEAAIATPGNWVMHLDAATELFNEIMKHHAVSETGLTCFMLVLLQLGTKPLTWTPKNHPWGSDQAILRFFAAQLLFIDTIASTSLQRPPRLQRWHQHLLLTVEDPSGLMPKTEKEQTLPHINLHEFVGVQNWVVASIADIAALDAWKKERKKNGSLSITELVSRAQPIKQRLLASLHALDEEDADAEPDGQTTTSSSSSSSSSGPVQPPLLQQQQPYFGGGILAGGRTTTTATTGVHTRIWAHAALAYLGVVVSGWQAWSGEVRGPVGRVVALLRRLPGRDCLRTLAWPFTVAGCLADRRQERVLRDMAAEAAAAAGPLRAFGTLRDGLAVLETVWARRAEIEANPDRWDLAACLGCLCQPALLI